MYAFKKTLSSLIVSAAVFLTWQVKANTLTAETETAPLSMPELEEGIELGPYAPLERRAYIPLPSSQREREKIYAKALFCPTALIESQFGGSEGVYAGIKLLQDFLNELKSGRYDFVKIQKECEKIRREMKAKPEDFTDYTKENIIGLIRRDKLQDWYILGRVLDKVFSSFGEATCSLKAIGITVGVKGALALGMGRYVCKTPLGISSIFMGPRLGIGILGGVMLGTSSDRFSLPSRSLFKIVPPISKSYEFYETFIVGRSKICTPDFYDGEDRKGYNLGLGFGGIDNYMFAVRLREPKLDMAIFYREVFSHIAEW